MEGKVDWGWDCDWSKITMTALEANATIKTYGGLEKALPTGTAAEDF